MTEEEAREKWCPFVRCSSVDARPDPDDKGRLVHMGGPGYNRLFVQEYPATQKMEPGGKHTRAVSSPSHCRCIASDCMMWAVDGCGLVRSNHAT
jgi:hypothetical protein